MKEAGGRRRRNAKTNLRIFYYNNVFAQNPTRPKRYYIVSPADMPTNPQHRVNRRMYQYNIATLYLIWSLNEISVLDYYFWTNI